jgi:hypothetical protein
VVDSKNGVAAARQVLRNGGVFGSSSLPSMGKQDDRKLQPGQGRLVQSRVGRRAARYFNFGLVPSLAVSRKHRHVWRGWSRLVVCGIPDLHNELTKIVRVRARPFVTRMIGPVKDPRCNGKLTSGRGQFDQALSVSACATAGILRICPRVPAPVRVFQAEQKS